MPRRSVFRPLNEEKYRGKIDHITARSNLERATMRFLDKNKNVLEWSSEEVIVPYVCATDGANHRYFVDLWVKMRNDKQLLVEIKPKSQTVQPALPKNDKQLPRYQAELSTWLKNSSKWAAANRFAESRGMKFVVWTEDHLRAMGIRFAK